MIEQFYDAISSWIDMKNLPLQISVITPCLNRAGYIEDAIQSVLRQNYSYVEHIVIDGGSTDGTLDILARYPQIRVVSEADQGMYEALNKGLGLAQGEIIGFLNADDLYMDDVFPSVIAHFHNCEVDVISGKAQIFQDQKDGTRKIILELSPPSPDKLVETAITGSTIFNAWFFRKAIVRKVGGFDQQYKISGDADLVLRLALLGIKYLPLDSIHYLYRAHEDSLTFQLNSGKLLRAFKDHKIFIKKHVFSHEISQDVKGFFNTLHANTCSALARQYRSEGKRLRSLCWQMRASFNISLPIFRYLAF